MYSRHMSPLTSPFVMIIFGATGDLSRRKLLPALFHLYRKKLLPEDFYLVGFSRRDYTEARFDTFAREAVQKHYDSHRWNDNDWEKFTSHLTYQQGHFGEKGGYEELIHKLETFDKTLNACVPRYFYLATPPMDYGSILDHLDSTKLSEGCGQGSDKWTKVMIEKPFGRDMEDARKLDLKLARIFREEQIYRIDHYLGKETVQNIVAFRYGNAIFDAIWNRQFIDHVQITIAETLGVETRGNFYEGVGALRDMAQSHLLELMAAIAMKPQSFGTHGLRDARSKVIKSIVPIESNYVGKNVVRGQYGNSLQTSAFRHQTEMNSSPPSLAKRGGVVDSSVKVPPLGQVRGLGGVHSSLQELERDIISNIKAYREEPNVDPASNTETFVALKLCLDMPHWHDVPFYLRSGKRLAKKATEIRVVFKEPRLKLFGQQHTGANVLTFRLEPNEGIEISMMAKKVGLETEFETIPLKFDYKKDTKLPEAYERILLDCLRGDQTLFTRTDEVTASWNIISKIIKSWEKDKPDFPNYAPGSWGPVGAAELVKKDGREWLSK